MTISALGSSDVTRRRLAAAILACELAVCAVSAQGLGDVARKEQARRKEVKSTGKVYTNDNLKSEPTLPQATTPQPATPTQTPAASDQSSQSASSTPDADAKKDEAHWKKRLQTERDNLERAKTYAEALQSRINALTTDFANRSDPAQRDVIASDRQKALTELDRLKQEVQQRTKALTDIQEEARRAGVPAGWLR